MSVEEWRALRAEQYHPVVYTLEFDRIRSQFKCHHWTESITKTSKQSYLDVKHGQAPALNGQTESLAP